jgi:hypothetical protein
VSSVARLLCFTGDEPCAESVALVLASFGFTSEDMAAAGAGESIQRDEYTLSALATGDGVLIGVDEDTSG